MSKQEKAGGVPRKMKIGYGAGALGMDLSFGLCASYFMNYATDVLLVNAAFMGVVMAAARIWGATNDPLMGVIVNNTKTKYGRLRPWIMAGAVLNSAALFLMFTNPGFKVSENVVNAGLYAYLAILYAFWVLSFTVIDIPFWSFVPALTSDPEERNVIVSIPRFFSGLAQFIVAGATPLLIGMFADSLPRMYSLWSLILAVLFIAGAAATFATTKERVVPKQEKPVKLREIFTTVKNNDQLQAFILTAVAFNTGWYLVTGTAVYYFKAVIQNTAMMTVFSAVCGVGQAVGLFGLVPLAKRFGKRKLVRLAMGVAIFGYSGMFAVSQLASPPLALFVFCGFVGCLGVGCSFTAQTSMLSDIVDYNEYKTGERPDAVIVSMKSVLLKIATSAQALITGVGLRLCAYDPVATAAGLPQPKSAQAGIPFIMFAIPPIIGLVGLIIFSKKYKLHGELMEKVTAYIAEKHAVDEQREFSI